ncbi:MAG: putative Ig domain-containing protein, partial [Planctomycetota bacterium]
TGTVTIDSAFNNLVAVSDAFAIALQPYNAPGLPPSNDLVINTGTGAIKGTPTVADTVPSTVWPVMIQSSNSAGRSTLVNPDLNSKAMTLTIQPLDPPVITSPGKATAVVGVPFSYTITATNGPTSYNATLPPALAATLSVNTVTGVISGTPAAGTTGVYNVTLTATNGIGPGTRPLQLTISLPVPPVITSPLNTLGIDGAPFTYTITATGTMPISYSAISVVQVGAVTQVLSGTQISSLDLDEPTAFVAIEKPITMLSGAAAGQTSTVLAFDLVTAPDGTTQGRITFGPAFTAPLAAGDKFSVVLSSQPLPQLLSIQNKTDPTTGQTTGVIAGRPIQAGTFNVLLSASNLATAPTNPGTPATTATLVLVINPTAPVITNTDLTATGVEGVPFSYTVQATGTQPLTIGVLDATPLPAGLTLSASAMNSQGIVQAIISGTPLPAAVGTTTVTLTAANHVTPLPNTATLTINISPAPPIITSPLTASAVDGIPFSYTITATGTPPVTFTATGLPNGLSLAGTTISGTPSGQIGSFNVILTATNSPLTTPDQKTLVITVAPAPPTITSLLTATANDGKPFSYTITASGTPPFTFSAAPPLPNGLALNGANITGTPVGPGTFTVVITAANLAGSDQKNLTITVNPTPPSITSPLTALAADGAPFTYTLTATGSAIISFGASNLPPGLALQGAVISGTPLGPAVTDVVLTATNPYGTDTKTLVLTVAPAPPVITDSTGHNFTEIAPPGNPFSYTITATGTLPIFFQAGNLPPGLSLSGAVISGTPTTIGVAKVSLIATNNIGHDQKTLVINVQPTSPSITSLLSAIGKDGVPFSYQITAFGSLPMTFGASPLPAGLSIAPLTGIISGTPTQPQVYNLAITATNNVSPFTDTKTLVITIQPSVQITSPLTAFGIVGQPFKVYTVTATGTAPIALSVDATSLPPGLTFSTSGNTISGTPTTAGIYYVSLTASNIAGSVVQVVAINIAQPSDDSDGDGFPNDLEIALGTDPNGINSTPFDGRPAGAVLIPTISNMSIKLDFTKAGKDSISIQGILPLVQNVAPGSETMTLVVGGIVRVFTLDKHGKAAQAFGNYLAPRTAAPGKNTFSLRVPKPYTQGTFTAALANTSGDFKKALGNPDIGLTNATVSLVPRTVRVYILLDKTTLYQVDELLFYTAKLNKTGIAKIR